MTNMISIPAFGKAHVLYDNVVQAWRLSEENCTVIQVPAIEVCRVAVVKFPVAYYQHFDYCPEALKLRNPHIVELGWSEESFDLPGTPVCIGRYSLLTDALKVTKTTLEGIGELTRAKRIYPSMVEIVKAEYDHRTDYCILYFNHAAYEFYHLLFLLGRKDDVVFENLPDPKIGTLPQLFAWARSFEDGRRKLYEEKGFTWEPVKEIGQ